MQRVQRRMGRMLPRTADESQVAVLLKDFEDVDKALDSLIASSKAWRDAWQAILKKQTLMASEWDGIYQDIVGAGSDYNDRPHLDTPQHIANRTMKLAKEYTELEVDMIQEINEMDLRMIKPAEEAKASIQPLKKTIKKRQDRKLDFERYQSRYDSSMKKIGRSDRENTALKKHEADLARSREEYQVADHKMREILPPVLQAVFSLLPHILNAQIMIQNNLLGHCYTQISEFCAQEGLPVPAPDFPGIVSTWELEFTDPKAQVESLKILSRGKTIGMPMKQPDKSPTPSQLRRPSYQSTASYRSEVSPARSDISSVTAQSIAPSPNINNKPAPNLATKPVTSPSPDCDHGRGRMLSVPSQGSLALSTPNYADSNQSLSPSTLGAASPAGPKADYFTRDRLPSGSSNGSASPSILAAAAAAKKKPPPPPKPKRINSTPLVFVTALYDFAGQGQGDLDFKEGDRIKVLKRTNSTQDWWEGELRGTKGSFPANYVQCA